MRFGFSSASMYSPGSKFFTSPAIRLLKFEASKSVIGPIPLRPARRDSQKASKPTPLGARIPIPVTTTRLRLIMRTTEKAKKRATPVRAGRKVAKILRIEAWQPLAYAKVTDSNIYNKCGHYISQPLPAYLFTFLSSIHKIDSSPPPRLSSNNALRYPYELPI